MENSQKQLVLITALILLILTSYSWSNYNDSHFEDLTTRITDIEIDLRGEPEYDDRQNATVFRISVFISGEVYNPNSHVIRLNDYNNCTDHAIDGWVTNVSFEARAMAVHYNFLGCNENNTGYDTNSFRPGINNIVRDTFIWLVLYGDKSTEGYIGNIGVILKSRYYDIEGYSTMISFDGVDTSLRFDQIPEGWGKPEGVVLNKILYLAWAVPVSLLLSTLIIRTYSYLKFSYERSK